MLQGKTVLLGVTGSIAAYKIAYLASALHKLHADVHVLMTKNATNFINPITFETLTGNKCLVDTFDRNFQFQVEHVSIAKKADVVMIAPASANVIGKIANGLADDMLTTTIMACRCHKIISPAMNTAMYENPIVQDNLRRLQSFGYEVITPASGYLACGDTGAGKMPEPAELLEYILREVACAKDLAGKKLLVTAGPTQEALDPVRYLTNHSSGKMGYAIAKMAMLRGAEVTRMRRGGKRGEPEWQWKNCVMCRNWKRSLQSNMRSRRRKRKRPSPWSSAPAPARSKTTAATATWRPGRRWRTPSSAPGSGRRRSSPKHARNAGRCRTRRAEDYPARRSGSRKRL